MVSHLRGLPLPRATLERPPVVDPGVLKGAPNPKGAAQTYFVHLPRKLHEMDKIGLGALPMPSDPLDSPLVPIVLVAPYFFRLKTGYTSRTSAYVFWFPIVRTDILPFIVCTY